MRKLKIYGFLITAAVLLTGFYSCSEDKITNSDVRVTGVNLNIPTLTMGLDHTVQLTATVLPEDATNKTVSWSSSSSHVKVDDQGNLIAVSEGTAVITVTTIDAGKTATCMVTVDPDFINVTGVKLDQSELTIWARETFTLKATIAPENAYNKTLEWTSSDESIATVDGNGVVTGVSIGEAVITVTTEDSGFTATCRVNVKEGRDVYATGFIFDNNTRETYGATWKNGQIIYEFHSSTADNGHFFITDAVWVDEQDNVYITGYEALQQGTTIIHIWKNGELLYKLNNEGILGYPPGLQVVDGDVYVVGYTNDADSNTASGKVWKNGEILYSYGGSGLVVTNGIHVDNGNVYVSGYHMNGESRRAKYWINDQETTLTEDRSEQGRFKQAEANGIYHYNGDVYVTGWEFHDETGMTIATMWKNGVKTYLGHKDLNSVCYNAVVYDGNLYTAGWHTNETGSPGTYWKNTEIHSNPAENSTYTNLRVIDGDVYTGGHYEYEGGVWIGGIWRNNVEIYTLSDGTNLQSTAHCIFIK